MASEAEQLIVDVLRAHGGPMTVAEIRRALRQRGRNLTEDFLQRTCASSSRIRNAGGGRFALLSHLEEAATAEESPDEEIRPDDVSLRHLGAIRRGSYIAVDLETTGTAPNVASIIQIGAVRVEEGRPAEIRPGLPFIVQSDFLLQANREALLDDSDWNLGLREEIAPAVVEAIRSGVSRPEFARSYLACIPLHPCAYGRGVKSLRAEAALLLGAALRDVEALRGACACYESAVRLGAARPPDSGKQVLAVRYAVERDEHDKIRTEAEKGRRSWLAADSLVEPSGDRAWDPVTGAFPEMQPPRWVDEVIALIPRGKE